MSRSGPAEPYDVAICGFGPAGEIAAGLLGRAGHRVLVVERDGESVYPLPRAVSMDAEVLRCLQQLEVADALAAGMLQLEGAEFVTEDGTHIMGATYPETTPLGWAPAYLYHQPDLDTMLRRAARQCPSVEVRFRTELTGFEQTADVVELHLRGDEGETRASALYLLGCDGASSFVRRHGGFGTDNLDFDQDWLVVDLVKTRPFDHPTIPQQICAPHRRITFVPGVGDRLRWEFQLRPEEDRATMAAPHRVFELLAPWLTPEDAELERSAVYRFHATVAARWRRERVFVLGDAAHQMPPFMGQGLCSGARDAFNLSWKLSTVLDGQAGGALLDTYEQERKPHATWTVDHAVSLGKLIDAFAAAAEGGEQPGPEHARSGYGGGRESPHLRQGLLYGESRLVGRPCAQPTVGQGGVIRVRLDDLMGPGWALLAREDPTPLLDTDTLAFWNQIGGRCLGLPAESCNPDPLARVFDEHLALIVRPDRIVYAAISHEDGAPALRAAVRHIERTFGAERPT